MTTHICWNKTETAGSTWPHTPHDLERCSYQSQTIGLAYRNCYKGVTDVKFLNMFMPVASDGMASKGMALAHIPLHS